MNAWIAWSLLNLFCIFQFMLQGSIGVMAQSMRIDLDLDAAAISLISSSFYVSYVLMQIPVGLIYDRVGIRKTVFYSSFLVALTCLAMAFVKTLFAAIVVRVFMGIGCAFSFVGLLAGARQWFEVKKFTSLMMVGESLSMAGLFVLNLILSILISKSSWQNSMLVFGVLGLLMSASLHFYIKETPQQRSSSVARLNLKELFLQIIVDMRNIITDLRIWLCGLIGGASFALITIFIAMWAIPFFRRAYNLDNIEATSLASLVYLGVALGCPVMAFLVRKFQILMIMMCCSVACAILVSFIIYLPSLPLSLLKALLLFLGFFLASYQLPFALVGGFVDKRLQSSAIGFTNMVNMSFAPIFQPVIGLVLSASSGGVFDNYEKYDILAYKKALLFIPFTQLLAVLLALLLYLKLRRSSN